jgi:hypothetical protein
MTAASIALRLGEWQVGLSGPRGIIEPTAAVLSSVALPEEGLPPLRVEISTGRARGTLGGHEVWTLDLPQRGGVPLLVGQVVGTATSILRRLLFVHAAAVELGGRGYMIVGAPGAGKTSIAAMLVREGAGYLSDEVALLNPASGELHPFALPLAVKPWTAKAAGRMPAVRHVASEGGLNYLLPVRRAKGRVGLDTVIQLDPREAATGPVEASRAEALFELSQHPSSFRYRGRLEDAFRGFVSLLRTARSLRIGSAHPAEAAAVIWATASQLDADAPRRTAT